MYKNIEYEFRSGVARLTLNRPPLNVLNIEMMEEINDAVSKSEKEAGIKMLVIGARGKAFSGGVDVGDHMEDKVKKMTEVFHRMCTLVVKYPYPTLAVLNGHALGGGCELAICCDFIVAVENAKIGQPEIKLGVYPPIAIIVLQKILGRKKALEMILTGETIDAREAYRIGLVNNIAAPEKLNEVAETMILGISQLSSAVLKITKAACNSAWEKDYDSALGVVEDIYLNKLMKTKDAVEGLSSFLEKRSPVWKNE